MSFNLLLFEMIEKDRDYYDSTKINVIDSGIFSSQLEVKKFVGNPVVINFSRPQNRVARKCILINRVRIYLSF